MNLSFYTHFFLLLFHQTSIAVLTRFFMNLKDLKKDLAAKLFNVDFHNKFIKFWIILFFQLSLYIYIDIYASVRVCVCP